MPRILLHQWEMSPFCNKVRRCLRRKGLAFEVKDYNGLEARKASKLSSVGTLPVIDYDGHRIVDSSAIATFLDERHPEAALYPKEPELRARVRFWDDWAGQSLYFYEIYFRMLDPIAREKAVDLICAGRPSFERAIIRTIFKQRYPKKLAAQGIGKLSTEEVERRFVVHLDDLEAILRRQSWLVGDQPTLADISVVAQLDEFVRTSRFASKILSYTRLADWMALTPGAAPG